MSEQYPSEYEKAVRYAKRRRSPEGYDGFLLKLFENPHDHLTASALADWFEDAGKPHTADVIRRYVNNPIWKENGGDRDFQVGINYPLNRREAQGPWNSRFYVYAPTATHGFGGEPFSYTSLTLRHPHDRNRLLYVGFHGTEREGAEKLIGLTAEGHEPYHPAAHRHEEFRAARPELFRDLLPQQGE